MKAASKPIENQQEKIETPKHSQKAESPSKASATIT